MFNKEIIRDNELEVNKFVCKLNKFLLGLVPITILLNLIGVFIVPWEQLILVMLVTVLFTGIPLLTYSRLSESSSYKYIVVICIMCLITVVYANLFMTLFLTILIPLIIATLYYDKKLLIITAILYIPSMLIGEIFSSIYQLEILARFEWIPLHMAINIFQLIILEFLFLYLANRARVMLENMHRLTSQNESLLEKTRNTSRGINDNVDIILEQVQETSVGIENISVSVDEIKDESKDIQSYINNTEEFVDVISNRINDILDQSNIIVKATENLIEVSKDSKNNLNETVDKVLNIMDNVKISKDNNDVLLKYSEEITTVLEFINSVVEQTDLLAINAHIEAARSGEKGKGFEVVASEVRKLSAETNKASESIKDIVNNISVDLEKSSIAINNTCEVVDTSVKEIENVSRSFKKLMNKEDVIAEKIVEINTLLVNLNEQGTKINGTMKSLSGNNKNNVDAISKISETINELSSSIQSIVPAIASVNEESNKLVNEN